MKKQIIVSAYRENVAWIPELWAPITLVYRCGVEEVRTKRDRNDTGMGSLGHEFRDAENLIRQAENIRMVYDRLHEILFQEEVQDSTKFGGKASVETPNDSNGREATQWLRHIIWNYDRLADVTCFLQGHPFDHCKNIIEEIETVANGNGTFPKSGSGSIGADDLKLVEAFWVENMQLPFDGLTQWSAGAQFYASRELIHTHPKSFYERLLNSVLATTRSGEIMERLWIKVLSTPCAE